MTGEEVDPALKEMAYDIGYGEKAFLAYVEPDVTTFYNGKPPASKKVVPNFTGLATKFVNMSKKPVKLFWEPYEGGRLDPMGTMGPFAATGTASHEGHIFVFATMDSVPKILHRVYITQKENTYVYDPYIVEGDTEATKKVLDKELDDKERELYEGWMDTIVFSEQYEAFTGRPYIANYLRGRPKHFMWRADYFGQEHWVETRETNFVQLPPDSDLPRLEQVSSDRKLKESDDRLLSEYRDPTQSTMNMTLRVISCAPRVLEIPNFLSQVEVDHVLKIAAGVTLSRSTIGDIGKGSQSQAIEDSSTEDTRTSRNSWLPRETSPIIDSIYRRAADLMRIDEALMRDRTQDEYPDWPTKASIAENLQLVHYDPGQKYTAHHDFGFSDLEDGDPELADSRFSQGTRFATLLLYLNDEGLVGGETTFPRWSNAETFEQLRVNPEEGKAVLFYSQLPDGNLDDLSQHAALPPRAGEKWLINLWVWDPLFPQ